MNTLSILINSAGISKPSLLIRQSSASIQEMLQVNLQSQILVTKAGVKSMLKSKTQGSIVNIGSVLSSRGVVGASTYAASKAGVVGFSKALAQEVGPRQIRVNVVEPGYIKTAMTDTVAAPNCALGRIGLPEDVANLVSFLCSDQASYITGQVFRCDGGL